MSSLCIYRGACQEGTTVPRETSARQHHSGYPSRQRFFGGDVQPLILRKKKIRLARKALAANQVNLTILCNQDYILMIYAKMLDYNKILYKMLNVKLVL